MGTESDSSTPRSPAVEIADGMVQIVRDHTGRGPTKARTVIGRDSVLVLMADTLTKAEIRLVEGGELELVLNTRQKVQRLMREPAIAMVEAAMDRKVIAFMSDNNAEPDMAAEVFVLEPEATAPASS